MIHKVRNPFYCRNNQFLQEGYLGQVLVVGIAVSALTGDTHTIRVGKNKTTLTASTADIKFKGQMWINKKGKKVLITPLDLFKESNEGT